MHGKLFLKIGRWEKGLKIGGIDGRWTVKNGGSWEIGPTNRWEIETPATLCMTYVRHHACALILFVILIGNN